MGHSARVITFSAVCPGKRQEQVLDLLRRQLNEAGNCSPYLLCFPEEVLIAGGDEANPRTTENNRTALELMQKSAREMHTNIVVGLMEPSDDYPGDFYNTAYVIGRGGDILGRYHKRHITFRGLPNHILPGGRVVTVDTDIGRIGLMICFDVGWREDGQTREEMGAEIVVWPAAYHGGNLLNAYAALHMYYVVSSVWNGTSRVIDPLGNTEAESGQWVDSASSVIDPGAPIFHIDRHWQPLHEILAAYGERLHIRWDSPGNTFELASRDPSLPVGEVVRRYNLLTYRDYHTNSAADNAAVLRTHPDAL